MNMYDLSRSSRYKSSYISYALNKAKATTALTHSINQFVVHFLLKIINGKIEGFETCADINAPAGPLAFLMLNFWIPRIPCNSLKPASGTLELPVTNCRNAAFSLRVRANNMFQNQPISLCSLNKDTHQREGTHAHTYTQRHMRRTFISRTITIVVSVFL